MDAPIDLKSMILLLEYQVLEDVNEILCPWTTLKEAERIKGLIFTVQERGVEEVELVVEIRERFDFWFYGLVVDDLAQSKKEGHAVEEAVPCERDSRHGM